MKKIVVVAHDAGGANILVSLALKYRKAFDWRFIVAGPAARIFAAHSSLEKQVCVNRMEAHLLDDPCPDIVITGTGWETNHEMLGIRFAKEKGIPVISYLDHWGNYKDRFGSASDWLANLPNFVAVGDVYAFERASQDGFPLTKMLMLENPYLESFLLSPQSTQTVLSNRLLFLSEPFDATFVPSSADYRNEHAGIEYRVLNSILRTVLGKRELSDYTLTIRLHPSEPINKYDEVLRTTDIAASTRIEIHDAFSRSLADDCSAVDCVIGISSMALLVSASLGRKTVSFVPEGMDVGLPHAEIVRCHDEEALLACLLDTRPVLTVDLKLFRRDFDIEINGLPSRIN